MKKFPKILLFIFALVAIAFVSCQIAFPSGTWRYKITVEVETPEGIKSGSAVREVFATSSFAFNPDVSSVYHSVSGEAVVVDLGKRGVLFVLIDWDSYNEFFAAFPYRSENLRDEIKHYKGLKNVKASLMQDGVYSRKIPTYFVTFKDLNDPLSVEGVDNQKMDITFGAGVRLKDVTIEPTDEPVTHEIEKWLPWLTGLKGHYLHGGMTSRNAPLGLHEGNFRTGAMR